MSIVPATPFGVVYAVTHSRDLERVRYYGQTTGILKRRRQGHYDTARAQEDRPIARWLRKYYENQDDIRFEVVRECYSREELDQAEIQLIKEGREKGWCDLNISAGGGGLSGVPNTEAQKAKISAALRGEGTWKHKLTWRDIREIRVRHSTGETIKGITSDYPVRECTVGQIVRNTTWIDPNYIPRGVRTYKPRLTESRVKSLREEAATSPARTLQDWGRHWGVDIGTASRIIRNEAYPDTSFDPGRIRTLTFAEFQSGLTWEQVRSIREIRCKKWESNTSLGDRYGLSPSAIRRLLSNETFYDPEFDPSRVVKYRDDKLEVR